MLEDKIRAYKKKLYRNILLKSSIIAVTLICSVFLIVNGLEYWGSFNQQTRGILFFGSVLIFGLALVFGVIKPIVDIFRTSKQISDEEAAKQIGSSFPDVKDSLLNTLQIQKSTYGSSDLISASIEQNSAKFSSTDFSTAISYRNSLHYLRYLVFPILIILAVVFLAPSFFTESTHKIINYDKEFIPTAPFTFEIQNQELLAFRNDNFELRLKTQGSALPSSVSIVTAEGRKLRMIKEGEGEFVYTFKNIQKDVNFFFDGSGYQSSTNLIAVRYRPNLANFNVRLDYPKYLGKKSETLSNVGNLLVPEGTKVAWQFKTQHADEVKMVFLNDSSAEEAQINEENLFEIEKTAKAATDYEIALKNEFAQNKEKIEYYLNVVPDEHPSINLQNYRDTVMFDYMIVGGNIGDDYGITGLNLKYRVTDERQTSKEKFKPIKIPFNRQAINQSYFYKMDVASLNLKAGQTLEYYVEVWDNDGFNGRKRSKTGVYRFDLPSKEALKESLKAETTKTESKIDKALKQADELNKSLEDVQNKLKGKKQLSWQDKKELEKILKDKEELSKTIQQLQEQNEQLNQKQNKFGNSEKELQQKAEQLQKLMDELLDEDTKKLYDELNKLLEQNYINQNLQETLDEMEFKQKNLQKELDRALELFKKLKFENKANEVASELEELAKKQNELAEETEELSKDEKGEEGKENKDSENSEDGNDGNKESGENNKEGENKEGLSEEEQKALQEKQEELNKEFEELQKEMDEMNQMNEEMKNSQNMDNLDEQREEVSEEQKNASEQLQQQQQQKASESQKKAGQKMQQMSQQLQSMMQSAQQMQMQENYEDLRQILDNLLMLSFNQEELMKEFRHIRKIDPKFVKLSQEQLKLKGDAGFIEDSLMSLSKRVFQIQSFVTREVTQMNKYMDESLDAIRRRIPEIASSKQQFTMTSVNNLALLLNDILDQMQQQMSQSMAGQQMNQKNNSSAPSMSDLQKQLNQKIQDLKKSGKSGRQLSEQLAKLAAEQEMIRNALKQSMGKGRKQMQGKKSGNGEAEGEEGDPYKEILQKMEKTEEDLVNKQLTEETIRRQKEILTRLLESEKSEKERELDKERKGETAKEKDRESPDANFDEYLKQKEMQVELLRTIPTSLKQYYKNEVNEYFKKIRK
ncbi:DUF4175 family protein [Sediminitomix flava]|uniref:Uncharacterized protein DUF4175 n=1 Tax=Sediminitomix flava TaxID=379075 RepID=A0A315Z1J3_SEDFL|nr:DUF4175 family protein [Sediminitomix flava]PWJ35990.1 uncharacterized protein DUF4175 [Sediminitomix flava]